MDTDAAAPPGRGGAPPGGRVRIERRGGLAGLRLSAECDRASLTTAQHDALARVFDSAAAGAAAAPALGADRFSFRIRLIGGPGEDRSVDIPEQAMPAALAALVRPALLP